MHQCNLRNGHDQCRYPRVSRCCETTSEQSLSNLAKLVLLTSLLIVKSFTSSRSLLYVLLLSPTSETMVVAVCLLFKYFFIMSVVVSVVSTVLLGRWHPIMVSPLVLLLRAINGSALSVDSAAISVDRYIAQQSVDRALIDRSLTYHFVHQLCNRPICTIDLT